MKVTNGLLFIYWIFFLICLVSAIFCIKNSKRKIKLLEWIEIDESEKGTLLGEIHVYWKVKVYFLQFLIVSIIWFCLTIFQNRYIFEFHFNRNIVYYYIVFFILSLLIILILCKKKFKIVCIILLVLGVCVIILWQRLYGNLAYDPDCWYEEYLYNKKIWKCNDKCEIVDGYSEYAFSQRYLNKYWEMPKENCYNYTYVAGEYICLDFEYPMDFSYKYMWYNEWINEKFSSDVEKIKEYNKCIRECWPRVESVMCLH